MKLFFLTLSIPMAWMLSPESLVLFGQSLGHSGGSYLILLPGFMVAWAVICVIHHPQVVKTGGDGTRLMVEEMGGVVGSTVTIIGRIPILLFASTGMLVTAGFAFNEIFVYWFPNFGFATLLLLFIAATHLMGERWVHLLQITAVSIVVFGMAVLVVSGISGMEPSVPSADEATGFSDPTIFFTGLLLLLGYDLVTGSGGPRKDVVLAALLLTVLLYLLWAYVSLGCVTSSELSATTVPHLVVARHIMEPYGRLIMGAIILAGACGGVNVLLNATRSAFESLSMLQILPRLFGSEGKGYPVVLFFTIAVIVLMFTGLAGEEVLEIYIFGALLFWLLRLSFHCCAASVVLHRYGRWQFALGYIVSTVLLGSFVVLLVTSVYRNELILFGFSVLSLAAVFLLAWAPYKKQC